MTWEVEYTDEFGEWWNSLTLEERKAVEFSVDLLEQKGPGLGFPHTSKVNGAKHSKMRELRSQYEGRPYRTFYVFDPARKAILLIGGEKTGNDQFYKEMVPVADKIYDEYLTETTGGNNEDA